MLLSIGYSAPIVMQGVASHHRQEQQQTPHRSINRWGGGFVI